MTSVAALLRTLVVVELATAGSLAAWLEHSHDWPLAAAILAGLAAPLAAHAAVVAANFGLAWLAASPTPPAHGLGVSRAISLYARELHDSLVVFQWAQPWLASRPLAGETGGAPRANGAVGEAVGAAQLPVLLVHGYLCNRQVWRPMARILAARGHAIASVDLEPVFGSIDAYVPIIEQAIAALKRGTGAARVALVCHSMGGLAARAYLRAHGAGSIARVITLGTPHRGTIHARFGCGTNARQMRRGSRWLDALAAGESAATRAMFTIVLSHHDNIVTPQSIQTLDGARVLEYSALGHLTLARAPEVGDAVADELERTAASAPR